jgi:amino acid transporter
VAVSSFGLLFFYTIANVSALRLKVKKRTYQKILPAVGAVSCVFMLGFLLFASSQSWIIGTVCLLAGTIYYVAKQKLRPT